MTSGRLLGGLGRHLDDLRDSLGKGGNLGADPFTRHLYQYCKLASSVPHGAILPSKL